MNIKRKNYVNQKVKATGSQQPANIKAKAKKNIFCKGVHTAKAERNNNTCVYVCTHILARSFFFLCWAVQAKNGPCRALAAAAQQRSVWAAKLPNNQQLTTPTAAPSRTRKHEHEDYSQVSTGRQRRHRQCFGIERSLSSFSSNQRRIRTLFQFVLSARAVRFSLSHTYSFAPVALNKSIQVLNSWTVCGSVRSAVIAIQQHPYPKQTNSFICFP